MSAPACRPRRCIRPHSVLTDANMDRRTFVPAPASGRMLEHRMGTTRPSRRAPASHRHGTRACTHEGAHAAAKVRAWMQHDAALQVFGKVDPVRRVAEHSKDSGLFDGYNNVHRELPRQTPSQRSTYHFDEREPTTTVDLGTRRPPRRARSAKNKSVAGAPPWLRRRSTRRRRSAPTPARAPTQACPCAPRSPSSPKCAPCTGARARSRSATPRGARARPAARFPAWAPCARPATLCDADGRPCTTPAVPDLGTAAPARRAASAHAQLHVRGPATHAMQTSAPPRPEASVRPRGRAASCPRKRPSQPRASAPSRRTHPRADT